MAITKDQKTATIKKHARGKTDTGSPEVQVGILTERINELNGHFLKNPKDNHSRRGMLMLVSKRRSLLDYLRRVDADRYKKLVSAVGIRK